MWRYSKHKLPSHPRVVERFVMLLRLLALVFTLLAGPALAGEALPECFAKPLGGGTYSVTKQTADGEWSYWWCPPAPTHPFDIAGPVVIAKRDGYKVSWPALDNLNIPQSLVAVWAANINVPCTDVSIKALCDAATTDAFANKPPPPLWVVAKNGTNTTRPVYAYVPPVVTVAATATAPAIMTPAKVGALIPAKRATVGAKCACWARGIVSGGSAYCAVDNGPTSTLLELTVCLRQLP